MLPFFNGQNSIKSVLYALYYQISIRCATLIRRRWINPPDERRINMGNPGLNFLFRQIQIENPTRCSLWQIRISSLVCRISFRTLEHSYFEFVSELVRHSVWRIRISIFVLLPVPHLPIYHSPITSYRFPVPFLSCLPSSVLRLPSPFVLRSSSLLPKSRSAKKVFKTCSKPAHFC